MDREPRKLAEILKNPLQMIRFPSITKLQYTGEDNPHFPQPQNKSKINSKHMTVYNTLHHHGHGKSPPIRSQNFAQTRHEFKLVHLPPSGDIMNICSMNIRDNKTADPTLSPRNQDGQENNRRSEQQRYLRKGKSNSVLNGITFQQSDGTSVKTNLSKFISTGLDSTRMSQPSIKLRMEKSQHLLQSKINMNELYSQIITALALTNGGILISGSSKSFLRIRRGRIDRGNNGFIVKQTAKKRSWWNVTDESQSLTGFNLVWTEGTIKQDRIPVPKQRWLSRLTDQQENKIVFQRNIDQALSFYPKMLQLFFTENQISQIFGEKNPEPTSLSKNRTTASFHSLHKKTVNLRFNKTHNIYNFLSEQKAFARLNHENTTIFNHIPNNEEISSKKLLYKNIWGYCGLLQKNPYEIMPKTYHITAFDWQEKVKYIEGESQKLKCRHAWFLKPGQNSNRGRGIQVFKSYQEVLDNITRNPPKSVKKSLILQEYIQPMLYEGRKFDIRCYMLCVQVFGCQTFYWYEQGYIRTSSSKFTMNKTSPQIHLTNDAVQKQFQNYDKFESANKLSYTDLDKYLQNQNGVEFFKKVLPKMKDIAIDVCKAAKKLGVNRSKQQNSGESKNQEGNIKNKSEEQGLNNQQKGIYFQIFGLDYILDTHGTPFLLEVNTNPCLEINSNLLSRIIPQLLENTFRIVMDVFMPSTKNGSIQVPDWSENFILNNKFLLLHRRKIYIPKIKQQIQNKQHINPKIEREEQKEYINKMQIKQSQHQGVEEEQLQFDEVKQENQNEVS